MAKRTKTRRAPDAGVQFLEALDGLEVPSLATARGTIRFDLDENGRTAHVRVAIDRGRISVSRGAAAADCVVRMEGKLCVDLVRGDANPLTAVLRGVLTFEGNAELLVRFRRALGQLREA